MLSILSTFRFTFSSVSAGHSAVSTPWRRRASTMISAPVAERGGPGGPAAEGDFDCMVLSFPDQLVGLLPSGALWLFRLAVALRGCSGQPAAPASKNDPSARRYIPGHNRATIPNPRDEPGCKPASRQAYPEYRLVRLPLSTEFQAGAPPGRGVSPPPASTTARRWLQLPRHLV